MTYVPTPDTRNSIVIQKSLDYRGGSRVFSNRYHFEGDLPADGAAWTTLADNIVAAEKAIFNPGVEIVGAIGYNCATATAKNLHGDSVFSKTYTQVGTLTPGGASVQAPGDCAAMARWSTPARSVRNHPVYLFAYWHGVFASAGNLDQIDGAQRTAMIAYCASWQTGFTDGTGARERCGPHGAVAIGHTVDLYIRHRDFPA